MAKILEYVLLIIVLPIIIPMYILGLLLGIVKCLIINPIMHGYMFSKNMFAVKHK